MTQTKHHPHHKATAKPYESNPFKVIFNGFDRLFKINQTWAIILLVLSLFGGFAQMFQYMIPGGSNSNPGSAGQVATSHPEFSGGLIAAIVVFVLIFGLIALVVSMVIGVFYQGSAAYVALRTAEGKTVGVGETLAAVAKKFWTILWIQIVVFFKILGGTLLLIVPGVRAALRYQLVLLPVFDEGKSASEAIQTTKTLAKDHLLEIFGMVTAASVIPFVGPIFTIGGMSVMYPQLKELKASGAPKPAVHWLNYLGFILLGSLLLFLLLLLAFIVLITIATN